MNTGISKRIILKTFHYHCRKLLSLQKNINISCAYHAVYLRHKNENYNSSFSFSKNLSQKNLFFASIPLHVNFQRNLSSTIKDFEETFNTVISTKKELIPAEEAAKIASSSLPEFAINVSQWKIVELAQNTLLNMHDFTGLPWWASIALSALMARATITLPFSLIQMQNSGKLMLIEKEMKDTIKVLKQEANYACSYHGWPEALAKQHFQKAVKKEWDSLVQRENCHPAKSYILLIIQLPLWFSFSIATRNLCYMLPEPDISAQITYMELMVGGFGWVTNLAASDPYMILPVMIGIINLAILETHNMFRVGPPSKLIRWSNNFCRFIFIALVPIASYMPAAMNVYWLTSSTFGLMQAFLLHSTRLRRFCGVPITIPEMEHPYRYFYTNLKSRLRLAEK